MRARDPQQPHRVSSSLELFFDLTFVVAVSMAAEQLFDFEHEGRLGAGLLAYVMVFFAIWWAWMNFTWFASAFDTDDWFYRAVTILQMAGVLIVAAGVEAAMRHGDYRLVATGYVVMRLALVSQWLRAGRDPSVTATATRYAGGVTAVQLGWVAALFGPEPTRVPVYFALVALELMVPLRAERAGAIPFHRHHITERYGLFTLIVLGEGMLSAAHAVIEGVADSAHLAALLGTAAAALVLLAGMWWVYFAREQAERIGGFASTFFFGYLHYLVFAAAAAFASGVEVSVARWSDRPAQLPEAVGTATTTVPVALFLLVVWVLALRPTLGAGRNTALVCLIAAIALSALVPLGLAPAAVLMLVIVVLVEAPGRSTVRRMDA